MTNSSDKIKNSGFKLYDKFSNNMYNVDDCMVGLSGHIDFYLYS